MILSRIRFGNYFHEHRCQDHADRKGESPRRAIGSHLLCPHANLTLPDYGRVACDACATRQSMSIQRCCLRTSLTTGYDEMKNNSALHTRDCVCLLIGIAWDKLAIFLLTTSAEASSALHSELLSATGSARLIPCRSTMLGRDSDTSPNCIDSGTLLETVKIARSSRRMARMIRTSAAPMP